MFLVVYQHPAVFIVRSIFIVVLSVLCLKITIQNNFFEFSSKGIAAGTKAKPTLARAAWIAVRAGRNGKNVL